ncbi:uncharacterized protein ASCRUDRAFT_77777, partial [Ascoidea rubescens DSM 1968]
MLKNRPTIKKIPSFSRESEAERSVKDRDLSLFSENQILTGMHAAARAAERATGVGNRPRRTTVRF